MDRVDTRLGSDLEDLLRHQVRLVGGCGPDQVRLVGEADVGRVAIGLGVDGDGAHAQFLAGADDPQRDLTSVGDQDGVEHEHDLQRREAWVTGV